MVKRKSKVRAADTAPFVFWDGYGLGNPNSGISVHGQRLAAGLRELGVIPTVVTPKPLPKGFAGVGESILKVPAAIGQNKLLWPIASYLQAAALMRRRLDTAIFHGLSNLNLPILKVIPTKKLRFVLTVHDLIPMLPRAKVSTAYRLQFQLAFARTLARAERVICVSEWTRDTLFDRFPAAHGKLHVIPNGLDLTDFKWTPKEPEKSILKVISVGRFESYKRFPFLLEVIRQAKGRLRLLIVTDPKGVQILGREGRDLVSRGLVRLKTNLTEPQKTREMAQADVYVQTSLYEGFCLPAAEAMASGLPVVFCQGSGIDEICDVDCDQGLNDDAPAGDWIDSIFAKYKFSTKTEFEKARLQHGELILDWKDAARATKSLYNELCISP